MMLGVFSAEELSPEHAKLYETCLKGSREDIRRYCNQGGIASQFIKDGMNPMHIVAVAGRPDGEAILGIMLDSGFNVNVKTRLGEDTVMHLVVEHIDVKEAFPLVLKILDYNPDLTIRNRKLRTPYDIALAKGEFELAEVLDGSMTPQQAREYYTQKIAAIYGAKLVDAVLRSNEQDIQDYIRLGADPNYVNEHKNGAIHYAITHCALPPKKTLQLLIDGKADVNLQDDEGDTALNLVIKSSKLRDSGQMYTCCELLLNNGALSTFKDLDGNDALSLAQKRKYDDIVKLLSGQRPKHIQDPKPLLLPLNEEPEEDDLDDLEEPPPPVTSPQEALVKATRERTLADVDEALFGLRADPNIPDDTGLYPIHHVLIRGEFENEEDRLSMLRSLIEAGADVNIQTVNSESTPLHVAATKNQEHAAQVLLDTHKCDLDMKNKHGKTAYQVAEEEECQEVMDVIDRHRQQVRDRLKNAAKKASTCTLL
ncbi:poly [ADP-ribose] polymerase tankyrase-1-like isoform X3 [Dreissena polymorpha]|uniref:poly [ADP-ribose] polymerase tankyrase-1-like isoform X3 n=1 Tax=Dreissena polymorpha TaxID=45954 RepID=UPI00226405E1|nr:poly [ADP-ribose] polymerase tankyrase-1-like isoform X3 [Dreissena polymorpha]